MTKEKVGGIYRIVCVKNGRYYYGSSNNIYKRWRSHTRQLRKGTHYNSIIQRSWDKWGGQSFHIELVEIVVKENLLETEQKYLDENVGKSNCMNMSYLANGGPPMGHQVSISTRRKISKTLKGRKLSKEHCERLCENHPRHWLGKKRPNVSGNNHHRYWLGKESPEKGKIRPNMQGDKHPRSKLTKKNVMRIRMLRENEGFSYQKIANEMGVGKSQISRICNKQNWNHIYKCSISRNI